MKLLDINGKTRYVNAFRYKIRWDAKSISKPQTDVKTFLKKFWSADMVVEEFPVLGTKMRCDIINFSKMVCVEIDGAQHEEFNAHFHKTKGNWVRSLRRDISKENWLELNGIKIARIYSKEIGLLTPKFFYDTFQIVL